jgi:hypothetical protein
MAESVENAFMRNHSVCAREYVACVIELHGHGISLQFVMPGPVPGIHVVTTMKQDVDGRNKSGHNRIIAATSLWVPVQNLRRKNPVQRCSL